MNTIIKLEYGENGHKIMVLITFQKFTIYI